MRFNFYFKTPRPLDAGASAAASGRRGGRQLGQEPTHFSHVESAFESLNVQILNKIVKRKRTCML
jgi:hypothetical protein